MIGDDTTRLQRVLNHSSDEDNPDAESMRKLMEEVRTIAVVGLSRDPEKAARSVPAYLAANDYDLIPVNPNAERIMGKDALDHLDDVEEPVDMVLVFRPSEDAGEVLATAAARTERPVIWLQSGIRADVEARRAREAGLTVVQDLCAYQVHKALG